MFVDDAPLEADVAIVLGNTIWPLPAAHAVELYRRGHASRLLFTGGPNAKLGAREADLMSAHAREAGIPNDAILVEPRAADTRENFAFAAEMLRQDIQAGVVQSVLIVAVHFHVRRAVLVARRHFPASALGWSSYQSPHYPSANRWASAHGQSDVYSELAKIEKYHALSLSDLIGQRP